MELQGSECDNPVPENTKIEHHDVRRFKCDNCGYRATKKGNLKAHIRSVHHEKDLNCTECDCATSHRSYLKLHVKAVHRKIRDCMCNQCEYAALTKNDLRKHVSRVHEKVRNFRCDSCDFATSVNQRLKQHVVADHYKIMEFKCDACAFEAASKGVLKRHVIAVHFKIKNFRCDECDYAASQKAHLISHVKAVHRKIKELKCDTCDLASSSPGVLRRHFRNVHCKAKDIKDYNRDCAISQQGVMKQRHVDISHQQIEGFKCRECDHAAASSNQLGLHIAEVHHVFKCKECSYVSVDENGLKFHVESIHENADKEKSRDLDPITVPSLKGATTAAMTITGGPPEEAHVTLDLESQEKNELDLLALALQCEASQNLPVGNKESTSKHCSRIPGDDTSHLETRQELEAIIDQWPHILFVYSGSTAKEFLSKTQWKWMRTELERKGVEELLLPSSNDTSSSVSFNVGWAGWKNGTGTFACRDLDSMTWYQNHIKELVRDGPNGVPERFRAWRRNEESDFQIAEIKFGPDTSMGRFSGDVIAQVIMKNARPSLPGSLHYIRSREEKGGIKYFRFKMSDDLALTLKNRNWKVNFITEIGEFEYKDNRGLERREEEMKTKKCLG